MCHGHWHWKWKLFISLSAVFWQRSFRRHNFCRMPNKWGCGAPNKRKIDWDVQTQYLINLIVQSGWQNFNIYEIIERKQMRFEVCVCVCVHEISPFFCHHLFERLIFFFSIFLVTYYIVPVLFYNNSSFW